MPYFSVIIPTFNRESLVRDAVASVFAQTDSDYELIVVDDGSTDKTVEVLTDYGPRLRLLQQPNSGPGAARNLAARSASGQYLVFLDSDDLFFPWALAAYREALNLSHSPTVVYGSARYFFSTDELSVEKPHQVVIETRPDYLASVDVCNAGFIRGIGTACLSAQAFARVGGFFEKPIYCEDLDLMFRLGISQGFAFVKEPRLVALRRHSGSSVGNLDRTYRGTLHLIEQEKAGAYPGDGARRRQRLELLCHHVRFISAMCAARGRTKAAIRLWFETLAWQLSLSRFKFALGLPLMPIVPRLNPVRSIER